MDFIIKLLKFKESIIGIEYDSILLIINKLTKRGYFILFLKEMGAEKITYIFYRNIMINHKTLKETIIN